MVESMTKDLIAETKKLIKIAHAEGKTMNLTEAFERHPVEEEVHEGKVEYILQGANKDEV